MTDAEIKSLVILALRCIRKAKHGAKNHDSAPNAVIDILQSMETKAVRCLKIAGKRHFGSTENFWDNL